ncbi:MAG: hypothetical protein Q7V63_03540 [Gammaproteobacteria bacterium]|nr:hypothetical protein [Gammaproteobacteria bacterium]
MSIEIKQRQQAFAKLQLKTQNSLIRKLAIAVEASKSRFPLIYTLTRQFVDLFTVAKQYSKEEAQQIYNTFVEENPWLKSNELGKRLYIDASQSSLDSEGPYDFEIVYSEPEILSDNTANKTIDGPRKNVSINDLIEQLKKSREEMESLWLESNIEEHQNV